MKINKIIICFLAVMIINACYCNRQNVIFDYKSNIYLKNKEINYRIEVYKVEKIDGNHSLRKDYKSRIIGQLELSLLRDSITMNNIDTDLALSLNNQYLSKHIGYKNRFKWPPSLDLFQDSTFSEELYWYFEEDITGINIKSLHIDSL